MDLTEELVLRQIEDLKRERQQAMNNLQRVAGAMHVCEHWLAHLRQPPPPVPKTAPADAQPAA